jgi:hypothetical protein
MNPVVSLDLEYLEVADGVEGNSVEEQTGSLRSSGRGSAPHTSILLTPELSEAIDSGDGEDSSYRPSREDARLRLSVSLPLFLTSWLLLLLLLASG